MMKGREYGNSSATPAKTRPMSESKPFWDSLWENIVSPKVSEEEVQACLDRVRDNLPTPVFWLLGKTQSGKTSVIRALTGSSRAEIGNGFRPCTRTAQLYDFPAPDDYFVQFLDTRGLGEVDYDPAEDMALAQDQAHLLMVVIKATDHAQKPVLEALEKIHKKRKDWPILVVQTCLHEGYPSPQTQHPLPYPFAEAPYPDELRDLGRSLQKQRELFDGMSARFVPVDFTLPEDGYEPVNYGLDPLWDAIEERLPLGLRAMMQYNRDARSPFGQVYFRRAHPHVISYSLAAGTAAAWPIPYMGTPVVLGIQAKMFHTIASIYNQELTRQRMAEISGALGVSYLVKLGGRELLKFIPGFGSAVSALYVAACTYAMGRTLCAYFAYTSEGHVPDKDMFRKMMEEQYQEGRRRMQEFLRGAKPQEEAS